MSRNRSLSLWFAIWKNDVKTRLQHRARRYGRSTEEEVCEILRNAVRDESAPRKPLGSRLRERFAGIGLEDDLPEWRGEVCRVGDLRGVE